MSPSRISSVSHAFQQFGYHPTCWSVSYSNTRQSFNPAYCLRVVDANYITKQLMWWLCIPLVLIVFGATVVAVAKNGLPPKNEIVAMFFVLLMIASFFSLLVGGCAFYLRARGRMRWVLLTFGMIGFPVSLIVLKSNLLDRPPTEPREGSLVRIGWNPTRYIGVENGETHYYMLEGDTLKPISAEEAEAYAK